MGLTYQIRMKTLRTLKFFLAVLLIAMAPSSVVHGQEVKSDQPPETIEELRKAILQVLQETRTPAAGIALVNGEGPVWIAGLGKADVEQDIESDEETMFRIGSVSKVFVALAILKLQEEGKIGLKDKVRDVVPEIEFENPWEDSHPILVEHLLEHTTGWDDLHLVEYEQQGARPWPLREALGLHPHSRISRWVPGTRMAYSNIGPNVAAYIVEKVTGQPYEEYIQEHFFSPMGMETMTYFLSEDYEQKGATLYKEGHPSEYGHMLMRASGSINASPKDMARMIQLFINRGKVDSVQLVPEEAIQRMETPSTTSGARAGLEYGYGLGLYTSPHKVFTYYKHGGGVGNGIADFSYLPEYGVGYSIMINSGNANAIWKLAALIRDFQTHSLPIPAIPTTALAASASRSINGYYQLINPANEMGFELPPLAATKIWTEGDTLYTQFPAFLGETSQYIPVNDSLYQSVKTKRVELAIVKDPLAGEVVELAHVGSGTITLGSVPGAFVFSRILGLILWILLIVLSFLLIPLWAIRYWMGKIPGGANIHIRLWPLLPVMFLLLALLLLSAGAMDGIGPLAKPTIFSVGAMIATIGFFAAATFSLIMVVYYRNRGLKKWVYVPAAILSVLHTLVAFYLLWHEVIGLRTWA